MILLVGKKVGKETTNLMQFLPIVMEDEAIVMLILVWMHVGSV